MCPDLLRAHLGSEGSDQGMQPAGDMSDPAVVDAVRHRSSASRMTTLVISQSRNRALSGIETVRYSVDRLGK